MASEEQSLIQSVLSFTLILNILYFSIMILLIVVILLKVKVKFFDRSNKIIIVSLVLTMVCQIIGLTMFEMDSQSENWTNIMNSINMTCDMVKWIIIFLFIFDSLQVQIYFSSNSQMELYKKQATLKKQRLYSMCLSTTFSLIYRIVIMIMITSDDLYFSNYEWLSKIGIVSRTLYLLCFTYISALWVNLVKEFISIKKENMKKNLMKVSVFNHFVIISIYTVTALAIFHNVWMGLSGMFEFIVRKELVNENKYQVFTEIFVIGLYPVESSLQFMEAIGLLYLFFYQARKEQLQQINDQERFKYQLSLQYLSNRNDSRSSVTNLKMAHATKLKNPSGLTSINSDDTHLFVEAHATNLTPLENHKDGSNKFTSDLSNNNLFNAHKLPTFQSDAQSGQQLKNQNFIQRLFTNDIIQVPNGNNNNQGHSALVASKDQGQIPHSASPNLKTNSILKSFLIEQLSNPSIYSE